MLIPIESELLTKLEDIPMKKLIFSLVIVAASLAATPGYSIISSGSMCGCIQPCFPQVSP